MQENAILASARDRISLEERLERQLTERAPKIAENLVLVFNAEASLGETLDSISVLFQEIGDPPAKFLVEDEAKRRRSLDPKLALDWLREHPTFRICKVLPQSERKNHEATVLSSAIAFNLSPYRKTLFLGIPWHASRAGDFGTQLRLLHLVLSTQKAAPTYGFGFKRPYGLDAGAFSMGYGLQTGGFAPSAEENAQLMAWSTELTGDPAKFSKRHRHLKGMILDVFPLNILSDVHLSRRVEGIEFRQWILQNTGADSLVELPERCFAWRVNEADTARLSNVLAGAGLIMARDPAR
jgi:hypothetical protein